MYSAVYKTEQTKHFFITQKIHTAGQYTQQIEQFIKTQFMQRKTVKFLQLRIWQWKCFQMEASSISRHVGAPAQAGRAGG